MGAGFSPQKWVTNSPKHSRLSFLYLCICESVFYWHPTLIAVFKHFFLAKQGGNVPILFFKCSCTYIPVWLSQKNFITFVVVMQTNWKKTVWMKCTKLTLQETWTAEVLVLWLLYCIFLLHIESEKERYEWIKTYHILLSDSSVGNTVIYNTTSWPPFFDNNIALISKRERRGWKIENSRPACLFFFRSRSGFLCISIRRWRPSWASPPHPCKRKILY